MPIARAWRRRDRSPRGRRSARGRRRRRFDPDRAPAYHSASVMADYVLERRLWLPRPRADIFTFFASPRNLTVVQPSWARPIWLVEPPARLEAGVLPGFPAGGGGGAAPPAG